jgi:transcriptional regulator with XRE-family HTH domain
MKLNEKHLYQRVGENIRLRRAQQDITQLDLAKAIGIERASLSCIEVGKHKPSIFLLWKMSDFFKISLIELLPSATEFLQHTIKTTNGSTVTVGPKTYDTFNRTLQLFRGN